MNGREKLTSVHLRRRAFVYPRQSSQGQLEHNTESTARQYALVERAVELGFARELVVVIDEDLGISADGTAERSGFQRLTAEVALGHAWLVLGLEVSRVARNNSDWYRLLDLCGVTDTVIGDFDGLYHPGSFNDRLLLGMKGTISEAELYMIRQRLDGGIRNKAARGELRKTLPVGLVWGEGDGEILLDSDEAVCGAIRTILDRFAELGSAHQVWLWLREQQLEFPLRRFTSSEIRWVTPSYDEVLKVLTNPAYAGAYAFGKTRRERYIDEQGRPRKRTRKVPRAEWEVLIWEHHPGYIDRATFEANQARIASNSRPRAHEPGGAVREGQALLQGIAVCGRCSRKLSVHYHGRRGHQSPGYECRRTGEEWCTRIGGVQIDEAVACALLQALTPAGVKAALALPPRSSKTTTRRLSSGGCRSSAPAMTPSGPSGATAKSSPSTGSSPAALNATGRKRSARSPRRRPNSASASASAPARSPTPSASSCSRSARTSAGCGRRRPPQTATANSCCDPWSKK